MKKMVKKILLGFMIISCTIGVAGCFNSTNNDRNREVEENIELNQKRTDIETLKKWFPKLEGMESAEWEAEVLGQSDDNSVPGPSSYRACGFIILDEEQAQKYRDEYEWKVEEIQMETQYVSIEEYQDNQWYYSAEWEEQVKPGYYIGKFYLSGNVIWFDVVK